MTTVVTSSHRSPPEDAAPGAAAPLPHRRKTPEPCRPSRQDRPLEKRGAFAPTAAVGQPRSPSQTNASLAEAARPSNRHRRQPPRCPPRVPSLEAFGRRPSVPAVRLRMGRHPKPLCGRPPPRKGFFAAGTGLVDCGHVSGLGVRPC
jgi:hypothetical protein